MNILHDIGCPKCGSKLITVVAKFSYQSDIGILIPKRTFEIELSNEEYISNTIVCGECGYELTTWEFERILSRIIISIYWEFPEVWGEIRKRSDGDVVFNLNGDFVIEDDRGLREYGVRAMDPLKESFPSPRLYIERDLLPDDFFREGDFIYYPSDFIKKVFNLDYTKSTEYVGLHFEFTKFGPVIDKIKIKDDIYMVDKRLHFNSMFVY